MVSMFYSSETSAFDLSGAKLEDSRRSKSCGGCGIKLFMFYEALILIILEGLPDE
jgi:hypothetical protein